RQVMRQRVTLGAADDVEIVHVPASLAFDRTPDRQISEGLGIGRRNRPPTFNLLSQMIELHQQYRGLQLIEPRASTVGDLGKLRLRPAVGAQHAAALDVSRIARDDKSGVPDRAKILCRIKAETADVADAADHPIPDRRVLGLCAIFYD